MRPRNATVRVLRQRARPVGVGVDGNTTLYRTVNEYDTVPARVWPVYAGDGRMLVELGDGRLTLVDLCDIRMEADDG